MKPRLSGLLLLALLALAFVVAGCGSTPQAPVQVAQAPIETPAQPAPTAPPPTNTAVPPTATLEPTATKAPTDTPAPTPTEEPTATPAVVADASNCVTCHTDEAALQELAVEEAPQESLSEGEG